MTATPESHTLPPSTEPAIPTLTPPQDWITDYSGKVMQFRGPVKGAGRWVEEELVNLMRVPARLPSIEDLSPPTEATMEDIAAYPEDLLYLTPDNLEKAIRLDEALGGLGDTRSLTEVLLRHYLTEENTDKLIASAVERLPIPWWLPKRVVTRILDALLPDLFLNIITTEPEH